MDFKRILFLVGQVPRIIRLLRELWVVFKGASDEDVIKLLEDVDRVNKQLRMAKTSDERSEAAARISDLLRRM